MLPSAPDVVAFRACRGYGWCRSRFLPSERRRSCQRRLSWPRSLLQSSPAWDSPLRGSILRTALLNEVVAAMEYVAEVGGARSALLPAADAVAPSGRHACYKWVSGLLQRATGFCYHGAADVVAPGGAHTCYKGIPALLQSFATMAWRRSYKGRMTLLQLAAFFAPRADRRCYLGEAVLLPMARLRGGVATGGVRRCYQGPLALLLYRRLRAGFLRRPPWPVVEMRSARRRCCISRRCPRRVSPAAPATTSPAAPATSFSGGAGDARNCSGDYCASREELGRGKR